jgi:oligopeptide/dipeptide ABC transporter ATP-binding protein
VLLEVKEVSNTYIRRSLFAGPQVKPVLDRINLTMRQGETFGLLGESGCGKTTLAKCVLGLIGYEGEIRIDGAAREKKRRRELAKKVQAVFQDPSTALNPVKTVGALLEEPLKIHRTGSGSRTERGRQVDETLALVGLDPSYKTRFPAELSGGQRQRVAIGCALMLKPKLIVADEPTSALDVSAASHIMNLFTTLRRRLNLGLLFISHNVKAVYHLADRIGVMYQGQIVEMGEAGAVYEQPLHPYTRFLLDCAAPDTPLNNDAPEMTEKNRAQCRFARECPWSSPRCVTEPPELVDTAPRGAPPHLTRCRRLRSLRLFHKRPAPRL